MAGIRALVGSAKKGFSDPADITVVSDSCRQTCALSDDKCGRSPVYAEVVILHDKTVDGSEFFRFVLEVGGGNADVFCGGIGENPAGEVALGVVGVNRNAAGVLDDDAEAVAGGDAV